ncbi:MAG TPA: biopolymer transporter ExbD [Burkholderiaceae bacterium]|nr:biopolymer transporter ExbD [Burkholderiaceae bacterium]
MKFRRGYAEDPEVNLIPLIDVLLVVLIFLAVSTTYSRFAQLRIELPSAEPNKSATHPQEIQVGVSADGRFAIGRTVVRVTDVAALTDLLREASAKLDDPVVVINADAQAPHQSVITVMEAARDAGLSRLSFATQRHANNSSR